MKKILTALAILILGCTTASAQWFLFPGGKNRKNAEKNIISKSDSVLLDITPEKMENAASIVEDTLTVDTGDCSPFVLDKPVTINLTLALPLKSLEGGSPNFLEMYSGALLAVRDIGRRGTKIKVNTIDTSDGSFPLTEEMIAQSDVFIGPVSAGELQKASSLCPVEKRIVSPLDPKAAQFVDSCRFIQVPSPWTSQYDDLADWIDEVKIFSDNLIVLCDSIPVSEQRDYLLSKISEHRLQYHSARSVPQSLSTTGRTLFMIASEREEYINNAIREIGALAGNLRTGDVILFCTSKARNGALDPRFLYNLNAHIVANYHIDYSDTAVTDFILAYRALFNFEPGSFAFQGYDTVTYFVQLCEIYGRQWYKKISEYPLRGLQSDFDFSSEEGDGKVNDAVRRVVYNRDFTSTLK